MTNSTARSDSDLQGGGHTPGPWQHDTGPSLSGRYHVVNDANGDMVCECYEGADRDRETNARLIAAAPDMLKALDDLVNSFEKHRPKEYWDAARAAIAKARGAA